MVSGEFEEPPPPGDPNDVVVTATLIDDGYGKRVTIGVASDNHVRTHIEFFCRLAGENVWNEILDVDGWTDEQTITTYDGVNGFEYNTTYEFMVRAYTD